MIPYQELASSRFQPLCLEALPRFTQRLSIKHWAHDSLHFVHSAQDEVPLFDAEGIHQLNALVGLKSLSLFYVFNPSDLRALWGLSSLETHNLALEDKIHIEDLCQIIMPVFHSLRKLRLFSEDCMEYSYCHGNLEIKFLRFAFGDLVHLE